MRRLGALLVALLGVASAATAIAASDAVAASPVVERGRYLALAADCGACHTATGGAAFAGGYAIASPLGSIHSTNITPSRQFGIGSYTEAQFSDAVRKGMRADGSHLYPAMPYTSYAALSDADVAALYAYFMQAVPAVERPAPVTALKFPFDMRAGIGVWNALFLEGRRFQADPAHSAEWNQGAYLVGALEHCGECHTPRGLLMQSRSSQALAGAALGAWQAPDITSDPIHGIGAWKPEEIATYLKTGRLDGKARAAGGMAEAITHSLGKLPDADLHAMAVYLSTVPAVKTSGSGTPPSGWGRPVSSEATLRGAKVQAEGASLYSGLCASCHQASGQGTADQVIPSLFHNSTVGAPSADNLVAVILNGVDRTTAAGQTFMPGFGSASYVQPLTDTQVAAVANYVRSTYGPGGVAITAEDVAVSRSGGPPSMLQAFANLGIGLAVAVVLALLAFVAWPRARNQPGTHA